eukprot:5250757-Alexandrium_andersonii.AAC.1
MGTSLIGMCNSSTCAGRTAGRFALRDSTVSAGISSARVPKPRGAGLCVRAPAPRRRHCKARPRPNQ